MFPVAGSSGALYGNMAALDVRNNSAVMKRAEQLKRWEESDTNREPPVPRPEKGRRIKFSSGCVFLAACLAGDKEEVIKLLDSGADINTANVDGLTALHQACIDDNLEMVEFLVEHGADINRQDNEGWTPLHATASCGFVSIAHYLVEHGADVAAVNSDGDLAVDLAVDIQHLGMIDFMQKMVAEHNIDCEKARQAEEQQMLNDAKRWLRSDASEVDRPHPKTGATALHVAAAKGYTKVLSLLLAGRGNVDKQDNDGWTPLHAAAHWSQKEAAEMLVDAMADMDVRNYAGQTCIDVAERKMVKFLEELRANNKRIKRRPSSQINSRISDTIEHNHIDNAANKIIRVEVRPDQSKEKLNVAQHLLALDSDNSCGYDGGNESADVDGGDSDRERPLPQYQLPKAFETDELDGELTDSTESYHSTSISEAEDEKQALEALTAQQQLQQQQQKNNTEITISEDEAPWRRNSLATRNRSPPESPVKNQVPDVKNTTTSTEATDVILRRTQSFENDEKFYQKYNELRARIKANSCPILPASLTNNTPSVLGPVNTTIQNYNSVQRSASLKDHRNFRKPATASTTTTAATTTTATPTTTNIVTVPTTIITTPVRSDENSPPRSTENTSVSTSNTANTQSNNNNKNAAAPSNEGTSKTTKQSAGNILKNFFKSFVPPVRDEESETQRKAHAKRVRETRRSTQGVTLDEIKSAEELVKKKNSSMANNNNTTDNNSNSNDAQTSTTSATTSQELGTQETITPSALIANVGGEAIDSTAAATPTPSANDVVQKREDESVRDDDDDITATFTIIAPTVKYRLPTSTEHERLDEMSATFTMTSRHESPAASPSSDSYTPIETTIVVTPPEITIDAPQEEKTDEDVDAEVKANELCASNESLSSVECQPAKNQENNETANVEKLTQTAAATVISFESKAEEHPEVNSETASELEATRGGTTVETPPPQPVMGPPSLDSPVRMREKRSIFDLDTVNSLSLGEKLRNEANKHSDDRSFTAISDQAASDSDRDSVFSNYSRRSLDSSPLHMGCGGASTTERRPSWRLKFDAGCKFKLEDASTGTTYPPTNSTIIPSAPAVIAAANLSSYAGQRRLNSSSNAINSSTQSLNSIGRPVSAPTTVNAATSVTNVGDTPNNDRTGDFSTSFPTRRCSVMTSTTAITTSTPSNTTTSALQTAAHPTSLLSKSGEDKENDKENDNRSSAATQAVLQRRRKPKRRSTGVVHLDMDDLDPERQDTNAETDEKESGNERTPRSRLTSSTNASATDDSKARVRSENGGDLIDYKALWEAVKLENEKLKQQLKKKDDEVIQSKATLERFTNATTKNSLSEIEKRERRAMERKLSEMEEELKQLEVFKTENQRLKEENGALIRVISKLSK